MPICSQCCKDKDREEFTKKQIRKPSNTRRCKTCVEAVHNRHEAAEQKQDKIRLEKMKKDMEDKMNREGALNEEEASSEVVRAGLKVRQNTTVRSISPDDKLELVGEQRTYVLTKCKKAILKMLERGIPLNCGLDGFGAEDLFGLLWKVVNNEYMLWLTLPLLTGLIKGGSEMNIKVAFRGVQGEPSPILFWLCQYKLLGTYLGYNGGYELVALALKAGADVNMEASNKTTPIFFAMKYASAKCVEILLDAGANIEQKDCYGQTIWKNAVERPDIEILELLIRRCNETIPISKQRLSVVNPNGRLEYHLPDHMLSLYGNMIKGSDNGEVYEIPTSWRILGEPSIEDLAVALVRIMQAGGRFSPVNTKLQELLKTNDPFSALNADPLSQTTHIESYCSRAVDCKYDQFEYDVIHFLRDVIYGRRLPTAIQQEIDEADQEPPETNDVCPICLTDMDCSDTHVTLYCGHRYCVECIKSYGENKKENLSLQGYNTGDSFVITGGNTKDDKRCPICRRLLCGDLLSEENNAIYRQRIRFGIDRHEASEQISGKRGPHLLTDEQLRFECKAVGINSEGSRSHLLSELHNSISASKLDNTDFRLPDGTTIPINMSEIKVELSATTGIVGGGDNPLVIIPPETGPVVIPIELKGVSILASLSPHSFVTVVPLSVVRTFGLKTKPITSSQFIDYSGRSISISAVVDELTFNIDSVEVCLNNAIVWEKETDKVGGIQRGIQLGMDFFESAAWTRCSTKFGGGNTFVVTDGGYTNNAFYQTQPDELRYYSRDGKICQLPFIHITHLARSHSIPIITLSGDMSKNDFGECQWCCRYFPSDGMLPCEHGSIKHYYCDEECKSKGLAVRARIKEDTS